MAAPLTAGAVAADIQRDDGPDAEGLIAAFRSSRLEAKRVLNELMAHRDPVVRAWVAWAAGQSLSKDDAVAIALRLSKDKDSDVRDVAIEELLALDLSAAAKLAATFRRKLESKDFYEPITAMWALAAIRDTDSIEAIRERSVRGGSALHRNTAMVICMLLEGRDAELVSRVRSHDHELMPWLSKAVRLLGTGESKAALVSCSQDAPDAECRNFCKEEVNKLEDAGLRLRR